ncbi:hypothetical protein CCHR01_01378 [Colletotrichum chrysophilum]|uniref:Uncharacterized protein n=1 Tax=Colletotrichum chrysophilum TaxID=1836956 RepID=A0AAD9AWW7_9PEZI|nr:hypothetical protein CCHR01_01378 [Colletotrichum chrysophilum]
MVPLLRSRSDNPHATLVAVVATAVRVTITKTFEHPCLSFSPRRRRSATKFVWVGSGARSSDLPEHAVRVFPSLQVLNWGPSQFHHETFEHPRHRYPVRSILGGGCVCHLPHRTTALMRDTRYPFAGRSIVSLPAATADDAEDDVAEISKKTTFPSAKTTFATHYKSICSVFRHNDLAFA